MSVEPLQTGSSWIWRTPDGRQLDLPWGKKGRRQTHPGEEEFRLLEFEGCKGLCESVLSQALGIGFCPVFEEKRERDG